MKFNIIGLTAIALSLTSSYVVAGPIAWGTCQTACNVGYGVCCAGAGGIGGKSSLLNLHSIP
jgi:hypothetical protein